MRVGLYQGMSLLVPKPTHKTPKDRPVPHRGAPWAAQPHRAMGGKAAQSPSHIQERVLLHVGLYQGMSSLMPKPTHKTPKDRPRGASRVRT